MGSGWKSRPNDLASIVQVNVYYFSSIVYFFQKVVSYVW